MGMCKEGEEIWQEGLRLATIKGKFHYLNPIDRAVLKKYMVTISNLEDEVATKDKTHKANCAQCRQYRKENADLMLDKYEEAVFGK
ncbi:MAG: hypothetical protein LBG88_02935 [Christensenellaceae bacterium]|jgi:hypothetical protein|nr:hypothetical protein [Christensenellaceae bacterium]